MQTHRTRRTDTERTVVAPAEPSWAVPSSLVQPVSDDSEPGRRSSPRSATHASRPASRTRSTRQPSCGSSIMGSRVSRSGSPAAAGSRSSRRQRRPGRHSHCPRARSWLTARCGIAGRHRPDQCLVARQPPGRHRARSAARSPQGSRAVGDAPTDVTPPAGPAGPRWGAPAWLRGHRRGRGLEGERGGVRAPPRAGSMDAEELAERMAEDWFDPAGLLVADTGRDSAASTGPSSTRPNLARSTSWGSTRPPRVRGSARSDARRSGPPARPGVDQVLLYVESDNAPAHKALRRSRLRARGHGHARAVSPTLTRPPAE